MSYSPVISYMMDRISGFSTNSYRLQVLGSATASANQIVRFELPSNSIVDIRKFAMAFKLAVSGAEMTRLSDVNNIIERVSITVGGTELSSGFSKYNVLHQIKKCLMGEEGCVLTDHPEIAREKSYNTGVAYTAAAGEPAADYRIDNWLSFLGECEPRCLDTSKFPPIQISITLASAQAVVVQAAASASIAEFETEPTTADGDYILTDIYATVPVLAFNDGLYDGMTEAILQKQGFLEIPYKNYVNFSDVGSSVRWNCSSASIDRIWSATRDPAHTSKQAPVLVEGYNGVYGKIFKFADEKYQSRYMNFPAPASTAGITSQHTINSSLLPQYLMSPMDAALITKQSVPKKYQNNHGLKTMTSNFNAACVRLNLEGSEQLRLASGLDSRSIALQGHLNFNGLNNQNTPIDVFVETTSVLRVGRNLMIEVVA